MLELQTCEELVGLGGTLELDACDDVEGFAIDDEDDPHPHTDEEDAGAELLGAEPWLELDAWDDVAGLIQEDEVDPLAAELDVEG